ncbi:27422_t:CDS:2, partial [Dentiscutata erythropus]
MIVRIKYVNLSEKDNNLRAVWAIGGYPIECESSEVKLVLFVPINLDECNPETQAIFEKDYFYSMIVSISTRLSILNKVDNSNKCPLKTSLVGVSQELPQVVENDDTSIFKLLISDYIGQEHSFIVKVVFQRFNPRFVNLKIRPQNSLIFQNIFDNVGSDNLSEVTNSTCAKLLSTHQ